MRSLGEIGEIARLSRDAWPEVDCTLKVSEKCAGSRKVHPRYLEAHQGQNGIPCEACGDFERERVLREAREKERELEEVERARRLDSVRSHLWKHLEDCGTPAGYSSFTRASWEKRFGSWEDHDIFRNLIGWPNDCPMRDESRHDWLILLYGKYGRRKTGLSTAIMGEALCMGRSCRFEDMNSWLRELRAHDFVNYESVWSRAANVDVLVFDDVGSIKGARIGGRRDSDWWKEEVSELLRFRHMHVKPTIVTSNGDIDSLGEIDRSLPSRMNVRLAWKMGGENERQKEVLRVRRDN